METKAKTRCIGAYISTEQAERFLLAVRAHDLTASQVIRRLVIRETARLEKIQERRAAS